MKNFKFFLKIRNNRERERERERWDKTHQDRPQGDFVCLQCKKAHPVQKAGLVSFIDIILGTTEHRFQNDDDLFQKLLSKHKNSKITLSVYNIKACTVREVVLIPMEWKGKGLLGVTIRFDSWEEDEGHYLHVLNVEEITFCSGGIGKR